MNNSIQRLKAQLRNIKHATPWEDVKAGEVYHIPPIVNLERRDIEVIAKEQLSLTYKRVDDTPLAETRVMHKTSVFSRFLVKRKKF